MWESESLITWTRQPIQLCNLSASRVHHVSLEAILTFTFAIIAGYWQSDKSRFTSCIVHTPGGSDHFDPLFRFYNTTWSKSFDYEAAQAVAAKASAAEDP